MSQAHLRVNSAFPPAPLATPMLLADGRPNTPWGMFFQSLLKPHIEFGIGQAFTVGVQTLNTIIKRPFVWTQLRWNISESIGQLPTGQNAIFDIQVSDNEGSTWVSIFPAGSANQLNIVPAGSKFGLITAFARNSVNATDWVRVNCMQIGNGGQPGQGLQGMLF